MTLRLFKKRRFLDAALNELCLLVVYLVTFDFLMSSYVAHGWGR